MFKNNIMTCQKKDFSKDNIEIFEVIITISY